MEARPGRLAAHVFVAPATSAEARAAVRPTAERLALDLAGVSLSTCHRVELYHAADAPSADVLLPGAARLDGEEVVHHVVGLALGLESTVLAEDQILHQLRTSVTAARRRGPLPSELGALFEVALRAGRLARSWRPERPRSLADVAVARIETAHGTLEGTTVLVVGAGEMGRLSAVAAAQRGAAVLVASPTPSHAAVVAEATGGRAVPFDPGPQSVAVDGVVIALRGPWSASAETMAVLVGVPAVVDLSMPPALPAATVTALGARHVGLDELAESGAPSVGLDRYRRRLEDLRDRTVRHYLDGLREREAAALAVVLAERIERERAAQLDALFQRLPDLPPEERDAIEGMTRHLAKRLFSTPLERLGTDPDGRHGRAARELFGL